MAFLSSIQAISTMRLNYCLLRLASVEVTICRLSLIRVSGDRKRIPMMIIAQTQVYHEIRLVIPTLGLLYFILAQPHLATTLSFALES